MYMVDTYHRLTPRYSIQDNNRHHSISPFLISADINESCGMACAPPPPTMLHITPIVLNIVLHHTILIIIFCPVGLFWCFNLLVCGVQAIVWLCTSTKKAFERYTQELLLSSAEKKLLLNLGILH